MTEQEFKEYAYGYLSDALDDDFPRIRNFFTDEEFETLKLKIVDINYQAFLDFPDIENVRNASFVENAIPILFDGMLDKIVNHNKPFDEGIYVALHKYLFNSEQFEKLKQLEEIKKTYDKEGN